MSLIFPDEMSEINEVSTEKIMVGNEGEIPKKIAASVLVTNIKSSISNEFVKKEAGKGLSSNDFTDQEKLKLSTLENYDDSEVKEALSEKADLDDTGKVPVSQLPSYVSDVHEFDTFSDFPAQGESGNIYISKNDNKQYRWSGTQYSQISSSLAIGETAETAYRGDRGKTAYDHSQIENKNPHKTNFNQLVFSEGISDSGELKKAFSDWLGVGSAGGLISVNSVESFICKRKGWMGSYEGMIEIIDFGTFKMFLKTAMSLPEWDHWAVSVEGYITGSQEIYFDSEFPVLKLGTGVQSSENGFSVGDGYYQASLTGGQSLVISDILPSEMKEQNNLFKTVHFNMKADLNATSIELEMTVRQFGSIPSTPFEGDRYASDKNGSAEIYRFDGSGWVKESDMPDYSVFVDHAGKFYNIRNGKIFLL